METERKTLSFIISNIVITLLYWGISHLNFMLFSRVGVLPMPIWPAAAVALIAYFLKGEKAFPGVILGTILANFLSLGAPLCFAITISVMNSLGPYFAIRLIDVRMGERRMIRNIGDVVIIFLLSYIMAPMLTATGGIGSKLLLGLMPADLFWEAWVKWFMAHSLGGLLLASPCYAFLFSRNRGVL